MLNEKRVKHMVKLASYEKKNGAEEYKVSSYFRGDYISFHVLCSLLWATVGFIAIVALFGIAYMELILDNLTTQRGIFILSVVGILYVMFMIMYGVLAYYHYKQKHLVARGRMKRFAKDLEILEKLYEGEV